VYTGIATSYTTVNVGLEQGYQHKPVRAFINLPSWPYKMMKRIMTKHYGCLIPS
jgi:hypothetical protein